VKLRRQGREYVGLSPFNKERARRFTSMTTRAFSTTSPPEHGELIGFLQRPTPEFVEA